MKPWEKTVGISILGFMCVVVFNDHAQLAAITQWQQIYGKEIDGMNRTIQTHWSQSYPQQQALENNATSTNALVQN